MSKPPPEGDNGDIVRPGISAGYLKAQDIARVNADEAAVLLGYRTRDNSGGTWIPYDEPHKTGALVVNGRPFGRLRLDNPSLGAKYLSPRDSGAQLYVPRNGGPFGKELVICEGEFKAIALGEAGIRAVAIGGICSACTQGELIPGLQKVLSKWPPKTLYFLGDNDTGLNFAFSVEATKLRKLLPETCKLLLPRIPLAMPKGIDDCREQEGASFMAFWEKIAAGAIEVSNKEDPSSLALRLLGPEWETIAKQKDVYLPKLIDLGSNLISETALDELAKRVKETFGTNISAFKSDATKKKHDRASEAGFSLPTTFYFDGSRYYRPNKDAFEQISREDAMLDLRAAGYWHRMAMGCELSPCEVVLHRIQTEHRVDYAGPICGRPPGLWHEGTASVLCTSGPTIISATKGDASPIEQFLASLFGKGRDSFFEQQFITFAGWVLHARDAIRNHEQHLPGQVLGLIGPADCGKSLLQSVITQCLGGREADASLWLVRGNDFNSDLWGAEHLRLGDEELSEDHRRRHGLRDRLKKLTTADVYPLHAKYCDSKNFRPIWRATLSANDDSDSISVLPMPTDSLADKIIYLRCYKPLNPYHDGSAKASKAFWQRLVESIPAFLYKIENNEFPAEYRESRFFIKEFHHTYVAGLIASNSPVAPLGELIMRFVIERGGKIDGSVTEIFEALKEWNKEKRGTSDYSSSAAHFGHQLYSLSELPGWKNCMTRSTRRIGGREKNQEQVVWSISVEATSDEIRR